MDWQFVVRHMASGILPETVALALYFLLLHVTGRKQTLAHIIASSVFCLYLLAILTLTGICISGTFSPNISLIPLVDMVKGPVDTVLNILLFVPMGIFLPLLYDKHDNIRIIAVEGFLISLSIEIAQMFGTGITDVNDLITNTLGSCLGYGAYTMLCNLIPSSYRDTLRAKELQCILEPLLFWAGSLIIMTTLQQQIFHTLYF